jgi:hypothetical protein
MQSNSSEGKPAPRVTLRIDIEFRKSYARQASFGVLKNISITGAFLQTNRATSLNIGEKLGLHFKLSGRERTIAAAVVWKNQYGCGVQFKPANNRDVQIIDDLIYFVNSSRENKKSVLEGILSKVG